MMVGVGGAVGGGGCVGGTYVAVGMITCVAGG